MKKFILSLSLETTPGPLLALLALIPTALGLMLLSALSGAISGRFHTLDTATLQTLFASLILLGFLRWLRD